MAATTVQDERFIAENFARARARLGGRELVTEALFFLGFFAAVAGTLVVAPPGSFSIASVVPCVLVLAFATGVRFDTPLGFTVPIQLGFVPLLFVAPVALVPLLVLAGIALATTIRIAARRTRPSRLLSLPGNCWFTLGPVAVFVAAGVDPRHAAAPLLLAALCSQFAVDLAVAVYRFGASVQAGIRDQVRQSWWVYAVDAALSPVGWLAGRVAHHQSFAVLALVPLLGLFLVFSRERRRRLEGVLELGSAYRGTALLLGDVIEADDGYTGQHCKSVVALALDVADQLDLDADRRRNLEFAALLHDVGKIAIPKDIINKAGRLSPDEWTVIKTHTVEGQRMLDRVGGFMHEVGQIVRSHHERWDGDGYPDALAGPQIPLEARIIACCDTWNAMRTDRAYRRALDVDVAMAELRAAAGTQLDPDVVQTLTGVLLRQEAADPHPGPAAVVSAAGQAA